MIRIIIGVILVIIGVVIGMGLQHYYPVFEFEDKIDIVGLATLIVTIFLAVYIPIFLERNMHNKRSEKDVIIRKIEGGKQQLEMSIISLANMCKTNCIICKLILFDKFIYFDFNELDTIITLSEHCGKDKFNKDFEEIKNCVSNIEQW